MVAAIQAGAVGTQACNEAIATIQSIVGDLETTAMFCTAGALNPEGKVGSFPGHRYIYNNLFLLICVCLLRGFVYTFSFMIDISIYLSIYPTDRVDILETAKQLVEDTKRLVSSAAGSQEQLASAAQKAVKTITNEVRYIVCECVK